MEYKHFNNKVYLINYHFVWCPKRRKKVLIGDIKLQLEELIREIAINNNFDIIALEIMSDHVHLFISANPMISPHKVIKLFKGKTSRILRNKFPELLKLPSLWTHSYFVSTAGNISNETIQKYIEMQSKK